MCWLRDRFHMLKISLPMSAEPHYSALSTGHSILWQLNRIVLTPFCNMTQSKFHDNKLFYELVSKAKTIDHLRYKAKESMRWLDAKRRTLLIWHYVAHCIPETQPPYHPSYQAPKYTVSLTALPCLKPTKKPTASPTSKPSLKPSTTPTTSSSS